MENGRLAALIALACGFLIGYKWPKIKSKIMPFYKKDIMPLYKRGVKDAEKFARKGIKKTYTFFAGRQNHKTKQTAAAEA